MGEGVGDDLVPLFGQAHAGFGAAEDVHRERQADFFGGLPEGLVGGVGVGLVGRRGAGDRDALDAHVGAALELGDGAVDVAQGDAAHADQPLRRVRAVVADPVVVPLEDRADHLDVVDHVGEQC